MVLDFDFFLKFTLLSYAAMLFFAIGLGLAWSRNQLNFLRIVLIFAVVAVCLSFSYVSEPLSHRLLISVTWTSVLYFGYRFGRKILQKSASPESSS